MISAGGRLDHGRSVRGRHRRVSRGIPIAAVNLAVGEYTWIAIFIVLKLISNRYRDQIGARHRAIV